MSANRHIELWLHLLLVPELKKPHWFRLQQGLGMPNAILGATAGEICRIAEVNEETARAILTGPDRETLENEIALLEQSGADLYTFDDDRYPELLRQADSPPMALYVEGELCPEDRYAVVVVGSRTMTQYGKLACQRITADLVGAGITIISGMAHGVDSVAHDTALRHGGRTIAVLAHGLAARDTSRRVELRKRIAGQGAVLSEFPMTSVPERYHFPQRNHTMAAMGIGTVIVEAQEKSGALITAQRAIEENRAVFAVPGDVTRQTSRGTNALIRDGATLIRNGDDVLRDLQPQLRSLLSDATGEGQATARLMNNESLSEMARAVLAKVDLEPIHLDLLQERLADKGVDFGTLSATLLELEMQGLIRHLPGNLYTTERTS